MRKFIPVIGKLYKLKAFYMYAPLGLDAWANLRVDSIEGGKAHCTHMYTHEDEREHVVVDIINIDPPIGWEPTYEIICKDVAQADRVITEWFARGINVWASHDLSRAGGMAFTPVGASGAPADTPASPHWRYTGLPAEIVAPEDCPKVFTVKWEEHRTVKGHDKAERKIEVAQLRREGWNCNWVKRWQEWNVWREHTVHQAEE